ncbi:Rieske 2Fe-2S domain-containing protein [Streptomyces sp. B1866]|uniref:Rieske 2Fe-2S domain-containing protein n=1 Tax=Streptomyces sp. B1866 TaxID=3075431 RepID=UPI00288FAA57|nr:Rieske 2Fe-2S domain-containing protein [Streptomyces sp. B1866]MDT3395954.1 Rieske 2Fe-2S domain-containing protein [Streptomyces sp. B1866]
MRFLRQYGRPISQGPTPADVARAPGLPSPSGWSALAFSDEIRPGTVLTRPLAGQDVVLYRLRTGGVQAVRPYCPHLGAHLGLATVEGNSLVCPFHFFAFGPDGSCVRTGYGTPPPKASLDRLPVHEVNGAVFVWRHHDGREPDWDIPVWHTVGHVRARQATWEFAGNAQEVIENAVDVGHFTTLHGSRARLGAPVTYDKATFHVSMRISERVPLIGAIEVEVEVDGYGMACLHADMAIPRVGLRMCTMVMPTGIGPGRMQFRQSNRVAFQEPSRLPPPLARAVARGTARLLERPLFWFNSAFTAADIPVWHHKSYQQPPRLAQGDGPIGPFRRWARQFYPEAA